MSTATRTAVTVVFRTDLEYGDTMAVFSGEAGTHGPEQDATAFTIAEGHVTTHRFWYERDTRPATAAESQPVWDALTARGYDVARATRMVWA